MMTEKTKFNLEKYKQPTIDATFFIVGFICLLLSLRALCRGDVASAVTGLTGGLVLLLASTMERFELLKGLGVEAKLRELNKTIDTAAATLKQLRELAGICSESLISLSAKVGRIGVAPSAPELYELVQRVKNNLEEVNSDDNAIKKATLPWVSVTTGDLVHVLLSEIFKPLKEHLEELQKQTRGLSQSNNPEDQKRLISLLDKKTELENFKKHSEANVYKWKLGTHTQKLNTIVEDIPLRDESERQGLRDLLRPWLGRLDYLAKNYDLSDKDEWFAKLTKVRDKK